MQTQNLFIALSAAAALLPSVYAAPAEAGPGAIVKAKCPYTAFRPKNGKLKPVYYGEADANSEEKISFATVKFGSDCKILESSGGKLLRVKNGHVDSW